jgi:hypothetical protein
MDRQRSHQPVQPSHQIKPILGAQPQTAEAIRSTSHDRISEQLQLFGTG